jgi:hypothetical protein
MLSTVKGPQKLVRESQATAGLTSQRCGHHKQPVIHCVQSEYIKNTIGAVVMAQAEKLCMSECTCVPKNYGKTMLRGYGFLPAL